MPLLEYKASYEWIIVLYAVSNSILRIKHIIILLRWLINGKEKQ